MNEESSPSSTELSLAFEAYLEMLEAGESPSREAFLDQYPDIRVELEDCLQGFDLVQALTDDVVQCAPPDTSLPANTAFVLGDYRIVREIGRGGMGVVYEAIQISLERRVAVKVLPFAPFLSERQRRRFKNEALAAASLKHPAIVDVYAVGCERSVHFYVMELVEGQDLASLVHGTHGNDNEMAQRNRTERRRGLSTTVGQVSDVTNVVPEYPDFFRNVARIGQQAASALHYAHREGIVHRDVKPANILLDQNGVVRITDFGLATMDSSEGLTCTGEMAGTLRYMSPEQIDGHSPVDQRTDVYSLGLTLYELIARRPAFAEDSRPELLRAKRERRPVPLSQLVPEIPRDLQIIIEKCTEHDPLDRYASAELVAEDLENYLSHRPLLARPSTTLTRLKRLVSRHPIPALSLSAVALLIVSIAVYATIAAHRYRKLAESQAVLSREQTSLLYVQSIRLANKAVEEGRFIDAEHELLTAIPPAQDLEDLRGVEWFYLHNLIKAKQGDATVCFDTLVSDMAFSPDGERFACAIGRQQIPIWRREPRVQRKPESLLAGNSLDLHFAKTRRDVPLQEQGRRGDVLLVGDKLGTVYAWNWQTLNRVFDPLTVDQDTTDERQVCSIDVHPNEPWLAAGTACLDGTGQLNVWDYRASRRILSRKNPDGAVFTAFIEEDLLFMSAVGCPSAYLLGLPTGQVRRRLDLPGAATIAAFSNAHRLAALGLRRNNENRDHWIEVRSLDDWPKKLVEFHLRDAPRSLDVSPSGRYVTAGDRTGRIYLADLQTGEVVDERRHHGLVTSVQFAPDESLLCSTGTDNVLQFSPPDFLGRPPEGIVRCEGITPSHATGAVFVDEHRVCVSRAGRYLDFWDARSGENRETWNLERGFGNHVRLRFHRGRKWLAAVQRQWPHDDQRDIPGRITVWNYDSGEVVMQHTVKQGPLALALQFSPDGRYLAVNAGTRVLCLDLLQSDVKSIQPFENWCFGCEFLADSRTLICASDDLAFFDVNSMQELRPRLLKGRGPILDVKLLPDKEVLAIVGMSKTLRLVDLRRGRIMRESRSFASPASGLDVSPDGTRIVVGTQGGKVRLFLTANCEELLNFDVPICAPFCQFSADGQSIVVAALDDAYVINGGSRAAVGLTREQLIHTLVRHRVYYP